MCEVGVKDKEIILQKTPHYYTFDIVVDLTFFPDSKLTLSGHVGSEKAGVDAEVETPAPRFVKSLLVSGMMGVKNGLLSVTGQVL